MQRPSKIFVNTHILTSTGTLLVTSTSWTNLFSINE